MDTSMRSEKITINVGTMDLAKIDLLVDSLEYSNRSDFCRIAIRELLEKHNDDFEKLYAQNTKVQFDSEMPAAGGIGIIRLSYEQLQTAIQSSQKINIMVIGILVVDKSVTPEMINAAVQNIKIYGKVHAQPDVLAIIKKKEKLGN